LYTTLHERFYERPVRFQNILIPEPLQRDPLELLAIETARLAVEAFDNPQRQLNIPIAIGVREAHERAAGGDFNAKLLPELADERHGLRFTRIDLAAGKLPTAGHVLPRGALRDEYPTVGATERGRND
jgi:hypothetical protein